MSGNNSLTPEDQRAKQLSPEFQKAATAAQAPNVRKGRESQVLKTVQVVLTPTGTTKLLNTADGQRKVERAQKLAQKEQAKVQSKTERLEQKHQLSQEFRRVKGKAIEQAP